MSDLRVCRETAGPDELDVRATLADVNEPKPITDEDLARFEEDCAEQVRTNDGTTYSPDGRIGLHLLAEVRRLRSDDWLERAAEEIDIAYASGGDPPRAMVLDILRKHRDG